jgi:hypothetical protein
MGPRTDRPVARLARRLKRPMVQLLGLLLHRLTVAAGLLTFSPYA